MSERSKTEDDHDLDEEIEAVEAGEVEPGPTSEEVERAAEREEQALEG